MVVHHKDGDRFNNDLSNLELLTHQEHSQHHNQKHPVKKSCEVCGDVFVPLPTKRARTRTCGRDCKIELQRRIALERYRKPEPVMAERLAAANRPIGVPT
jgi:hypothetical protein